MDKGMHPWKTIRDATTGVALSLAVFPGAAIALNIQPGIGSGPVIATQTGDGFQLRNHAIAATVLVTEGKVRDVVVTDRLHGTKLRADAPFAILLKDGSIYDVNTLRLIGDYKARTDRAAGCIASRRQTTRRRVRPLSGKQRPFPPGCLVLILLDGSSYLEAESHDLYGRPRRPN